MEYNFYKCSKCNEIVIKEKSETNTIICCDEQLELLMPNTTEASVEKHVPDATFDGEKLVVKVGVIEHPQSQEHYVSHIAVVNNSKIQMQKIKHSEPAQAEFYGLDEGKTEIYAYCNNHGLWFSTIII